MKDELLKSKIKKLAKGTTIKIDVKTRLKLNKFRSHKRETWDDLVGKVIKKVEKKRK